MINSMTAFARIESQVSVGNLTCEIRSINHRYLEVSIYLPEMLRALEMPMRELIRQHIKRGKIECSIRYQANISENNTTFNINMSLAKELCQACDTISGFLKDPAPIPASDILRFPGTLVTQETDLSELKKEVLPILESTLKDLVAARGREGHELEKLFLNRLDLMQHELNKVKQKLPSIITEARERLNKRFSEAKIELDPNRLEQEMMMFAQKIDVAEEIERTETHIAEVQRIFKQGGMSGRRLDFLMQELNREANTLGSKSVDTTVTHAAVEMKVLIEQMREQVQNVE